MPASCSFFRPTTALKSILIHARQYSSSSNLLQVQEIELLYTCVIYQLPSAIHRTEEVVLWQVDNTSAVVYGNLSAPKLQQELKV